MSIKTYRSEGIPVADRYVTVPFKLMNINRTGSDSWLRYMVMAATPGILDGDQYRLSIEVTDSTQLELQTQSYQRIFKMKEEGGADQITKITVGDGAAFQFIPHPSVPHESSIFDNYTLIHLHENATLYWGELLTCGRKLSGEIFAFKYFHNHTEIFCNGKLMFKDRVLLEPEKMNMQALGQLEGFTHQATFFYYKKDTDVKLLADFLMENRGDQNDEMMLGVSETAYGGLVLRMLGMSAEFLFDKLKECAALIKEKNQN